MSSRRPASRPVSQGTAGDGQSQQRLQSPARLLVVQRAVWLVAKRETTSANSTAEREVSRTVVTSPAIRARPDRRACSEMLGEPR
jgi:hypothetical protein